MAIYTINYQHIRMSSIILIINNNPNYHLLRKYTPRNPGSTNLQKEFMLMLHTMNYLLQYL